MFKHGLSRVTTALAGLLLLAAPVMAQPTGAELTRLAEQGENLFRQKCAACHSLGEGDRPAGPDLAGVTERRERAWLIDFIADPGKLIAAGDPVAVELLSRFNNLKMPALRLEPDQIEALLVFLAHPTEAVLHAKPQPAPDVSGQAKRGARLFTGAVPLANGGAPCLACHGIAGVGLAGGANYGPDLTTLYENFGEDGVAGILESLPFPSMEPIYATRPLTAEEQLDLGAYFAQISGTPVVNDRLLLTEVASGVLMLLGVFWIFGRGRLHGVRRALVARASNQKGGMQ
jgi:mono/diheme cytochrome c family protein